MPDLSAAPRRLAVLGSPIAHSLSPALHRAAYAELGLDWQYDRAEVASGELGQFLDETTDAAAETTDAATDATDSAAAATTEAAARPWRGLSLTMPLKREVLPLLDTISPLAAALGVANTVVIDDDGRRHGHNTDVDGIVRTVEAHHDARPASATILGGGATASSAMWAAWQLGARSFSVHLRNPMRAGELTSLASELGCDVSIAPLTELGTLAPLDFVISTLPGGVADDLPLRPRSTASILFDVAYEPWPTRVASTWTADGGIAFSGLDMLFEQAVSQVRLFTGLPQEERLDDENRVRAAMRAAVGLPAEPTTTSAKTAATSSAVA
ncbi:shikimate dehydrogenase [Frigoribacterium sp. PvP032]|uniref:shikimate dehydrogenase family protein n=1 Tax=Frigoribacterium sp. PvP032 TaxID=2806589 RepID=UPI001B64F67A|nr:shikimate dehydrogenase [Frigoribacterium sp. PvP032]MBP1189598.1 shikimate dehydrogenase [Frigoribacterium sp. PvP032]